MPGTSGLLSPFSKIKGLYFDDSKEPDNFMYEFKKDLKRILADKGVNYVDINLDNKDDFYKVMNNLADFINDDIKMYWRTANDLNITLERVEELE